MPSESVSEALISEWAKALRDAQLLYAHLNPESKRISDSQLFRLAHEALLERRDPHDLLVQLFPGQSSQQ